VATSPEKSPRGHVAGSSPRVADKSPRGHEPESAPKELKRWVILDSREGFVGPFVVEYEYVDQHNGKLQWGTVEDLDKLGPGKLGEAFIKQFETHPPGPRKRTAVVVPEEKPAPVPVQAPPPTAVVVAQPPPVKRKATLIDKLDGALSNLDRKLAGSNTSPRRQVPPLDLESRNKAEGQKSPRGHAVLDSNKEPPRSPRDASIDKKSPREGVVEQKKSPREAVVEPPRSPRDASVDKKSPRDVSVDKKSPRDEVVDNGVRGAGVSPRTAATRAAEEKSPREQRGNTSTGSLVERMRTLKQLFADGLIEEHEYQAKRKELLDAL
jgi:hypothetical protein